MSTPRFLLNQFGICSIILFSILLLFACSSTPYYMKHEARTDITAYGNWQEKSIQQRVQPIPEFVLDYLHVDTGDTSIKPYTLSSDQKATVEQALNEFPESILKRIETHVVGIYFVENLGSSGYTESIMLEQGGYHCFTVFDKIIFEKTLQELLTYRTKTAFKNFLTHDLSYVLFDNPNEDSIQKSIEFIFAHEFGHVLQITENWGINWFSDTESIQDYPFLQISWETASQSNYDEEYSYRKALKFYYFNSTPEDKIEGHWLPQVFEQLSQTSFVSLYGSYSIHEDVAESFALYIHCILKKRPYRVLITDDDQKVFEFISPYLRPDAQPFAKTEFFETHLAEPAASISFLDPYRNPNQTP